MNFAQSKGGSKMHPVLSIGAYLLVSLLILFITIRFGLNKSVIPGEKKASKLVFRIVVILYLLFTSLPIFGALLPDSRIKFFLQAAGNIWLGFYFYFSFTWIILTLILVLCCLIKHKKFRKARPVVLLISFAVGTVLLVYGMIHAQNTIITEYDVVIEKSAGDHRDLKLILLGDLHLSVNSRLSTTEKMVEMINEQQPDVVVIAGDIFTSSYGGLKDPEKYAAALRGMKSTYGVYAVYGNHDVEETLFGGFPISPVSEAFRTEEMEQFFADCAFTVLYDETVSIADGMVQITGRVDGEKAGDGTAERKSPAEVLADVDLQKPVIVLQHEPVEFAALKECGADLALCGHTHAGQIFPGNLIVPFFNENAYGYRLMGNLDTFVTSGVGYYGPPMRVGTNSEIMVINIHFVVEEDDN